MAPFKRRRGRHVGLPGVTGPARIARRSDHVAVGMRPGDIAIIDRPGLDAEDASALLSAQVAAVVNISPSVGGTFPTTGPELLARAGVLLVDDVGDGLVTRLRGGDLVRVDDGKVYRDGVLIATGVARDADRVRADYAQATNDLAVRLDTLAVNVSEHLRREHAMLIDGDHIPKLRTDLRGRPVVIVSDSFDAAADLKALKRFILDRDPLLIGAGRGSDVIQKVGHRPDIVVGPEESFSSKALDSAKEIVITTASGRIKSPELFEPHRSEITAFVAEGEAVDLAMLLADGNGADVIVHAGAAPTLSDFLGQSPGLTGPAFVARLRAASKLVDAKAVGHLTSGRISGWVFWAFLATACLVLAVAFAFTPPGRDLVDGVAGVRDGFVTWFEGLRS
ncbi:MAG: putative cytokinetic ring protein SteA [Aeromicrobium sp.]|uniref:putative cytokinetic ring protein SteA n=1 Tax=Aeromicrobium sp. TaxID=1871063 RepID=UPI0039E6CA24